MIKQPFLTVSYLLVVAGLTIKLAHAQLNPIPYTHLGEGSQSFMSALEAPSSECMILTEDTILQDDAPCIWVGDGITLDLSGHNVFGDIVGVDSGSDVTIKNGTVAEGSIVLLGTNNLLAMLTVRDSGLTFAVQISGGVITHSIFERNTVAVDLFFGDRVEVRYSFFHANEIGVNIPSDNYSSVHSNVFTENGTGVRIFDEDFGGASGNTIQQNFFQENAYGVFLDARSEANDNHIQDNLFFSNKSSAIVVRLACERMLTNQCAGRGTQLHRNWLIKNGGQAQLLSGIWTLSTGEQQPYEVALDDGLTVIALPEPGVADGVTVTDNLALLNTDFGIDAPGVIDGGQNRAVNNGNFTQCVGVQCNLQENRGQIMSQD